MQDSTWVHQIANECQWEGFLKSKRTVHKSKMNDHEGTQRYKQRHWLEEASGIGKGKEFHKGTTDTKREDLWDTKWVCGTNYENVIMTGKGVEKKYLTQVKAVLFAVISTTSYYRFLGSAPFKSHVVFMVSNLTTCAQKYRRTRNRSGRSGNVFITEACGVSIPWIHSSFSCVELQLVEWQLVGGQLPLATVWMVAG